MERIVAGDAILEVDPVRGTFRVKRGEAVILPWSASAVTVASGERIDTGSMTSHEERRTDAGELEVVHAGARGTLVQRFRPADVPGGIEMDLLFRSGAADAAVDRLHHLAFDSTRGESSAFEPGGGLWMWRHGTVSPGDPVFFLRLDATSVPETGDRWLWLVEDGDRVGITSETLALFRSTTSGRACLLAFTTLADQACGFVVRRERDAFDRVSIESRCDLENLRCRPGAELRAETLLILPTDDPWRAAEAYADLVARRRRATFPGGPLVGWSDWQYYRREIGETDVLENLDALARGRYPVDYLLVDDGYQRNMSDWLVPNERFARGIAWLAERIRGKGFKPGIWIAPLTAHASSELVREHPDWLVRDAAGEILAHRSHMGTIHAVDYTVPAAADWLRALVRTLVHDCGYRWIKLDGPIRRYYAGGVFRGREITSVQHIRLALGIIREAAGDAIVEGEGYYGPSIGLVDTQRVTQDVQQAWPRLRHTAQVNLLSTFLQRRWWINNPDAFILRDTPTPHYAPDGRPEDVMSTDELQTEITALALTGGVVMLTDRMAELRDDRRALVDAFIPVYATPARPVDLFNGKTCPEIFHQPVRTDAERYDVIAVFNWDDVARTMRVSLDGVELAAADGRVAFEFWTQTFLGVVAGELDLGEVPAHGVRVVALRAMREHPFVMGTSVHLTQGGVELRETRWDDAACVLSGRVSSWASGRAVVHICVPDGYIHPGARGKHLCVETAAGREVAFEARFRRT